MKSKYVLESRCLRGKYQVSTTIIGSSPHLGILPLLLEAPILDLSQIFSDLIV